jgi:hypothetical protein
VARFGGMDESRFRAMARRASANADHTSPLRLVVAWGIGLDPEHPELPRLKLACGHVVRYPQGGWGEEYSAGTRRRCYLCVAARR